MRNLILLISITLLLTGCQTDNLTLGEPAPIVVVEGWLTDQSKTQHLKISQTQSFNSNETAPTIDDAIVYVKRNSGDSVVYSSIGNGEYQSNETFAGRLNSTYQLFIELPNGQLIRSSQERMHLAPSIDSLYYDSYERESESDPNLIETIYFPKAQIQDKEGFNNYYRWRVFRNDTLFSSPEHMVLINDRFFDGNSPTIENEFTIFEYFENDSIGLELHEISHQAYDYLRLLKSQTTTLGTVSSVTPAPIDGNLTYVNSGEDVLGYWGVTSVKKAGIKIIQ